MTTRDYELNATVCNRVIEILPNGKIIDRYMTYDEYINNDEVKKIREEASNG